MGNKRLVLCCIAGIVLGFVCPLFLPVIRSTALSVGMVAGLAIGYLLDTLSEKKEQQAGRTVISEKARDANRLLKEARAEISGEPIAEAAEEEEEEEWEEEPEETSGLSAEEQAESLNEAAELLRRAREKIK